MFFRKRWCRNFRNEDIKIEELKNKVSQGAILIDVRSNQEYREGHLQGAINIPEFEIDKTIKRILPKKNQLIIVYCQYGGRSRSAMEKMKKIGYINVYNLYGGLDYYKIN